MPPDTLLPYQLVHDMAREIVGRIDELGREMRVGMKDLNDRLVVVETEHHRNHPSNGNGQKGLELGRAVAQALQDSGPLSRDAMAAKPPEQQLDAAAKVLGLPLWKALLYALLLGGALAGGGKGTGALLERFFPAPHQAQTTTTTQTGR